MSYIASLALIVSLTKIWKATVAIRSMIEIAPKEGT
jgi:hypothetical protein